MPKEKTIRVCDCGAPLIWTFCFDGAEYFCMNCGSIGGMLGTGRDEKATSELILKKAIIDAIWKELYSKGRLLPKGNYQKDKCKKCVSGVYHNQHLTKKELELNVEGWIMLRKFRGIFDRVEEE